MKLRQLTAGLAAGCLALSLAGCNRGEDSADGYRMTLAVSTLSNPFFIELRDGAQAAADEEGVTLDVVDAQDDASVQQNQLADAATQGVDAVIINPVDSEAAGAAVGPVMNADIPIIAADRTVEGQDIAATVSSDNVAGGRQAAQALAEAIGEKGEVIVLQGVPGTSASRDRGSGFSEGIGEYENISVVAKQPANFSRAEGLDVATNLLQAHPNVVGIFAENDEMALGAIQALGDRAGSDVFVVGFDGTDDGLNAIEAKSLYATIAQQPDELGRQAVLAAIRQLKGEELEKEIPVEVKTVTEANLADFMK